MHNRFLAIGLLLGLGFQALACDVDGHSGFLPENKMYIPVGLKFAGGITEVQFNKVITKIENLYKAEVTKAGGNLVVLRNWTDGTVNAYAKQTEESKDWEVAMFGGLARHPQVTEDGFAVVMCHELGHHIGGAPKKYASSGSKYWASNEGQADYFGTLKCLRRYFENDNNIEIAKTLNAPAVVSAKCAEIYKNENEIAICIRSAMAGYSVGRLFNALSGDGVVDFTKPSTKVVTSTYDAHPASQCRLDTYYQAALCDRPVADAVSNTDEAQGVCYKKAGDSIGYRPACWFKEAL